MFPESENIFGNRLKLARKLAGLSLQELSDRLENKVSKQSLSKYEVGFMRPTTEVLIALSRVLNVRPDYFMKKDQVELGQIQFRKRASLSRKDEDSIVEKARDYVERFLEIESILDIKSDFSNPIEHLVIHTKQQVEQAADLLREKWELGTNPISSIVEMLELKGVKVILIDETDAIDGFATITSNGIPIIVVNTREKSIERIRFTIIHELAHLLLIFDVTINEDHDVVEKLCHFFASCFLLPTKMLLKMIGSLKRNYVAIEELKSIKEYYGISIRATIHRLRELQIITESYYQRWTIYLSKTYGSRFEPGIYSGAEKASLLKQLVYRALSNDLISLSKAAMLCNTSIDEFRKNNTSVS